MQAIQTKYLGPTNFKGSRVKASAQSGSIILSWDDALNADENHHVAALALMRKLDWVDFSILGGQLPDQTYAWVLKRTLKNH